MATIILKGLFAATVIGTAGCSLPTHEIHGTVTSVGSETTGGAFTLNSTTRYIKLGGDPNVYDCPLTDVPACGPVTAGQKVSLTVDKYGHVSDLTYLD